MSDDWKDILKDDVEKEWGDQSPGQGYGTRGTAQEAQYETDLQGFGEEQIEERTDKYHAGMNKTYAHNNNSGHAWVAIGEFDHDDEWGYNQDR